MVGLPGVLCTRGQRLDARRAADPRTGVIVLVANALSAVLCPILVYPAGLGLEGSAIANLSRRPSVRRCSFGRSPAQRSASVPNAP